jgi:hypothetical protein
MTDVDNTDNARLAAAKRIIGREGFWNEGEDLDATTYDDCCFDAGAAEYLILTDDEADARANDSIRESAWAFNASFLVDYLPEGVGEEVVEALQPQSEGANDAILAMIGERFDDFASDAISADGRGHFLSGYDGEEIEDGEWFGYRTS